MSWSKQRWIDSYVYYDNSTNGNPIAPFQCVSLANAVEVAAAATAGVREAQLGHLVVPTPTGAILGATSASRRVLGVTTAPVKNGDEAAIQVGGVAMIMCNAAAAVAEDASDWLTVVAAATRTSLQTPFTSAPILNLPVDPTFSLTYNLSMIGVAGYVWTTGAGTNAPFFPVGFAIEPAGAQYDIIPVLLGTDVRVG